MGQFDRELLGLTDSAAMAAQEALGTTQELTIVNNKPPAWVLLDGWDGRQGEDAPNVAVRITTGQDPEALLEETIEIAALTKSIRDRGGRVLEILEPPKLVREKFVAVISRYLPGADVTPYDYMDTVWQQCITPAYGQDCHIRTGLLILSSLQEKHINILQNARQMELPLGLGRPLFRKACLMNLEIALSRKKQPYPGFLV